MLNASRAELNAAFERRETLVAVAAQVVIGVARALGEG
jgi:hypothetical protein